MSDYKPTFRVSPKKRPWYKRLTPLAWFFIGVAVLVVVLGIVAAAMAFGNRHASGEPWWTPTPTLPPSPTPIPPTPTPTATPGPVPAHPAWWTDEMTQDEDGNWWPPEEVIEMVKEAYNADYEAGRRFLVDTRPPDYDALEEARREWNSGPELEGALRLIEKMRSGEEPIFFAEWEVCILQVQDFTPDGLECTLGVVCQNGVVSQYDPRTGELISQEHRDNSGLGLIRMRYDPASGHWKRYEFLDFVPPQ